MAYPLDKKVFHISELPNKDNIKYSLAKKSVSTADIFAPLAEKVRQLRMKRDKTIILAGMYESVSYIYKFFK